MTRSPLEELSIAHLIDPAELPGAARPFDLQRNSLGLGLGLGEGPAAESAPFRATSVDSRLAEIDEVLGGGEHPLSPSSASRTKKNSAGRPLPRATGSASMPILDSTAVAPAVRALPGGHAFALILPAKQLKNAEHLRSLPNPRELYLRVREFLRELRAGLFGFQREILRTPALRAQLRMQLDSDVELSLVGAAPGAAESAQIAAALVRAADTMRDALALFAKVVEIVAALVKAATNPVHAVRAIYQALRGLYELLVAHYAARGT